MTATNRFDNIPAEKFRFVENGGTIHDRKFDTKPVSYFQGAFRRFSKNKGAVVGGIVILFLVLFALIAPLFTPYIPLYYDMTFAYASPKINAFADSDIDLASEETQNIKVYAIYGGIVAPKLIDNSKITFTSSKTSPVSTA